MAAQDRIAEFKEVAEMMPDDPVVRFGLAAAYLDAGRAGAGGVEYTDATRLHPAPGEGRRLPPAGGPRRRVKRRAKRGTREELIGNVRGCLSGTGDDRERSLAKPVGPATQGRPGRGGPRARPGRRADR